MVLKRKLMKKKKKKVESREDFLIKEYSQEDLVWIVDMYKEHGIGIGTLTRHSDNDNREELASTITFIELFSDPKAVDNIKKMYPKSYGSTMKVIRH
jgi:hypothetical protein